MRLLSLFQTADGGWHWVSILAIAGWLATGAIIFATLLVNRNDRVNQGSWEFSKEQAANFAASLKDAIKGKIAIEYTKADEKRPEISP
jgi:hypothetical protein